MKLDSDAKADALYVRFASDKIVDSEEVRPGIIFDFDEQGHIVAIELLGAREKLTPAALSELQAA